MSPHSGPAVSLALEASWPAMDAPGSKPLSPPAAHETTPTDERFPPVGSQPVSSRSVRWISPSKLERKRTLDRINQRASRAKTRARVDELEKEVSDLKSRLQDAETDAAASRKRADSLRAAIRTMHSAMIEADELSDEIAISPRASPNEVGKSPSCDLQARLDNDVVVKDAKMRKKRRKSTLSTQSTSILSGSRQPDNGPNLASSGSMQAHFPMLDVQDHCTGAPYGHGVSITDPDSGFKYGLPSTVKGVATIPNHLQLETFFDLRVADFSFNTIDQDFNMASDPAVDAPWAGSPEHAWGGHIQRQSSCACAPPPDPRPIWSVPMQHLAPQVRLDRLIRNMADGLRQLGARSNSASEYHSPSFPSVKSLLNPQDESESERHPVSTELGKHGDVWSNVHALPEKLALLHGIGRFVRWQVQPNQANWEAMVPSMRPTDLQRQVPHPAWVDGVQWPEARDVIIRQGDWSIIYELRDRFNTHFSINWPHQSREIFVAAGEGEVALSPLFLNHIRDLRNWTADTDWPEALSFLQHIIPRRVVR